MVATSRSQMPATTALLCRLSELCGDWAVVSKPGVCPYMWPLSGSAPVIRLV